MKPSIEQADCMVQAVASVLQRPELIEPLRRIRVEQLEQSGAQLNNEVEESNLRNLLAVGGCTLSLSVVTIRQLSEIEELVKAGDRILIGLPRGSSSEPAHIVHLQERFEQEESMQGDFARPAWKGYKSPQGYTADEVIIWRLMEQGEIPAYVLR